MASKDQHHRSPFVINRSSRDQPERPVLDKITQQYYRGIITITGWIDFLQYPSPGRVSSTTLMQNTPSNFFPEINLSHILKMADQQDTLAQADKIQMEPCDVDQT